MVLRRVVRASVVPEEAMIPGKTFLDLDLDICFYVPSRDPICVEDREEVAWLDNSFCARKYSEFKREICKAKKTEFCPRPHPPRSGVG